MNVQPKTPIGEVRFLQVPLDNSYTDTLRFTDMPAQYAYFESLSGITINGFTEIRTVNTDTIRVPVNSDELTNYNYMMFKNANYSNKWFFAFITKLEYVSPSMTLVTFEMDVMQTWQFEWLLRDCYIEREHTTTDVIGDNLIDEGLEVGDYIYTSYLDTYYSDAECTSITAGPIFESIVVASSFDISDGFPDAEGAIYTGVYSGLHYSVWDMQNTGGLEGLSRFLSEAAKENKSDGIVSIFMMPSYFVVNGSQTGVGSETKYAYNKVTFPDTLDGYEPRCNKLFTAPYSGLFVTNNEGQDQYLRREFFGNTEYAVFRLGADMSPTCTVMLVPMKYASGSLNIPNFVFKMTLGNYPQCAYTIDTYKAWLAQNALPIITNVGSSLAQTMAIGGEGFLEGTTGSGALAIGLVDNIIKSISKAAVASTKAPTVQGAGIGSTNIANGTKKFTIYNYSVHKDYAKVIDDFFWAYGYAIKEIRTPNIDSRKYWNYIKTNGCKLGGFLPFNDAAKIKTIFDRGITFWHVNDGVVQIGNYSYDNSPAIKGYSEEVETNGKEQK